MTSDRQMISKLITRAHGRRSRDPKFNSRYAALFRYVTTLIYLEVERKIAVPVAEHGSYYAAVTTETI
eukprot:scaffold54168_cov31-Prasinocladus_malaysianus.AAC.2